MCCDEIDNTGRKKSNKEEYRSESDTKNCKTKSQKEGVIDAKYMHSDDLFEEVEHEYDYADLEKQSQKAISKTKVEEKFKKSRK